HRGRGLAEPAPLHAEPVQRPVRHHDPLPLQQHPDLHDRQPRLHPRLDLALAGLELLPPQAVAARPRRADHLRDLADQLIGQLPGPAIAVQPGRHRSVHIPAGALTLHPPPPRLPPPPPPPHPPPHHPHAPPPR